MEIEVCLSVVRSVEMGKHVLSAVDVAGECASKTSGRDSGSAQLSNRVPRQREQNSGPRFLWGSLGSFSLVLHSY